MKKLIFALALFILANPLINFAQNAQATIGEVTSCPGAQVVVPLDVENFINVGAMTLYITYDTTKLKFETITNISSSFPGLMFNAMVFPVTQIGISFTSLNGVSLPSGKLFDMIFTHKEGHGDLAFGPACELTTPDFLNIEVDYYDGGVIAIVAIDQQPQEVAVYQPGEAFFSVGSTGGESFQWQRSNNNGVSFSDLSATSVFQGVNTPELHITSTSNFLNGWLFRCIITNGDCTVVSDSAKLIIKTPLNQIITLQPGWNSLSSYVLPFNPDPGVLFAELGANLEIIYSGDKVYAPSAGINSFGDFDPALGYAIKMNAANNLTITGTPAETGSLTIPEGWSFLPVPVNCEVDIQMLFDALITEVAIIQELAGVSLFWPDLEINSLTSLQPGKAYLIKMKSEILLTYPDCP